MYNKIMKKISVLLILVLLAGFSQPCEAGIFSEQKAKIEQNRIQKTTISEIKALFGEQTKQANKHSLIGLQSLYSRDFVNSDGFNYDTYMKMVEETWETILVIMHQLRLLKQPMLLRKKLSVILKLLVKCIQFLNVYII